MILLQTGWVAEVNFQVSLFNEVSAEIIIPSSCQAMVALKIFDVLIQAAQPMCTLFIYGLTGTGM